MTKKELWDFQFDNLISTADFRPTNCSICNNQVDERKMLCFKRITHKTNANGFFELELKKEYCCKSCFLCLS